MSRGLDLTLLSLLALAGGCHGGDGAVTVFAASSLQDALPAVPGAPRARFNFAGSQALATQLLNGARADVFASADEQHLAALERAGLLEPPVVFARNELVLVVPRGRPTVVHALADLPKASRVVLGAPEVPVGAYTAQVLQNARATLGDDFPQRVAARVVSHELNVRQVLARVARGEADAALVYRSDAVAAAKEVDAVELPAGLNVRATYPLAVLREAPHPEAARAFVAAVLSPAGQAALVRAGFLPAEPGR